MTTPSTPSATPQPTPLTDAAICRTHHNDAGEVVEQFVNAKDFADLERQLAAMKAERDGAQKRFDDLCKFQRSEHRRLVPEIPMSTHPIHSVIVEYQKTKNDLARVTAERDDYREESKKSADYILMLAKLLGCSDGDDTP